jgi:hypothetical protein
MPAYGSLARYAKIEDRRGPSFYELRLGASRFGLEEWDVPTDGLLVILIGAAMVGGWMRMRAVILATVSAHALTRRYERGRRDDASVFEDLTTLAFAYPSLVDTTDNWNCPAGDGVWVGYSVRAGGDAALNVSTFLADTMLAPAPGPSGDLATLVATMPVMTFREAGTTENRRPELATASRPKVEESQDRAISAAGGA